MEALKLFADDDIINIRARLHEQERIIERTINGWHECGRALEVVRAERLYRLDHPTFEAYTVHRWGIKKSEAYDRIKVAKVADTVAPKQTMTRSAADALNDYPGEEFRKRVWDRAKAEVPNPTGEDIQYFASLELLEDAEKVPVKDQRAVVDQRAKSRAKAASVAAKRERMKDLQTKALRRVPQAADLLEELAALPKFARLADVARRQRALANEVRVLLAGRG